MVHVRLTFSVCLLNCSHSSERKITGMAIADITLLSGFVPKTEDLDLVSYSYTLNIFFNLHNMNHRYNIYLLYFYILY